MRDKHFKKDNKHFKVCLDKFINIRDVIFFGGMVVKIVNKMMRRNKTNHYFCSDLFLYASDQSWLHV
jgi:hypothetical protein